MVYRVGYAAHGVEISFFRYISFPYSSFYYIGVD